MIIIPIIDEVSFQSCKIQILFAHAVILLSTISESAVLRSYPYDLDDSNKLSALGEQSSVMILDMIIR